MKLVKLSLAAIVAAGAMTTFASATPLEEAIKGVEVSGMARYRFYHQSDNGNGVNDSQRNRFSGELNVVSPVTDNLKFGMTVATDINNYAANSPSSSDNAYIDKFWFQYAINDFSIKAGKMEVSTPWTETGFNGTRGNGILALYTGLPNWAFALAYFNQINGTPLENALGEEDIAVAAAIGSYDIVGLQAWASTMEHAFDYNVFAQVDFRLAGFNALAQMNYMRLNDDVNSKIGGFSDDSGIFMGFKVGYSTDMFFVEGGYTKTDEDMPIYALTADNDAFLKAGQQLFYLTTNTQDVDVFFARAGINYNKFGFEVGYGVSDQHTVSGTDLEEYYGLISYQVAKNFGLQAYYSVLDEKSNGTNDNDEFRFQAVYNF